jgi:hypothetical protein
MLDRYRYLEKLAKYSHQDDYVREFHHHSSRHFESTPAVGESPAVSNDESFREGSSEELLLLALGATSGIGAIALVLYPLVF